MGVLKLPEWLNDKSVGAWRSLVQKCNPDSKCSVSLCLPDYVVPVWLLQAEGPQGSQSYQRQEKSSQKGPHWWIEQKRAGAKCNRLAQPAGSEAAAWRCAEKRHSFTVGRIEDWWWVCQVSPSHGLWLTWAQLGPYQSTRLQASTLRRAPARDGKVRRWH